MATLLLLATAGLTAAPAPSASATPGNKAYDAPLEVTIDDLTPGVLPAKGPITVRGTVTNVDLETWTHVRLYPMFGVCSTCAPPMTTEAELAAATKTDPETFVGERYTQSNTARYDVPQDLGPGETVSYSFTIPQAALREAVPSPQAGVYWFGVHALGASPSAGDDQNADGRARTFLPYLPASTDASVDAAVVVPLRARIAHAADGELGRTVAWEQALSTAGTLGGPLSFGGARGSAPVTWLLDPALPDAVTQLAQGNPTREIAPVKPDEEPSSSEDPSSGESPSGDAGEGGDDAADVGSATLDPDSPVVGAAESWLRQARAALSGGSVALLPYGDPDLSGAATTLPDLYATAREHSSTTLAAWEVEGTPVVGSPNGYLDATAIRRVDDGAVLLLGDQMFPEETFSPQAPVGGLVGNRPVVVTSSGVARGGPGPDPAQAPVALRQRLLSEAVVRILAARGDERPEPLTVVIPDTIDAAGARAFWTGLEGISWLRLVDLPSLVTSGGIDAGTARDRQVDPDDLSYPDGQREAEVPPTVFAEAGALIRSARTLQSILGKDFSIGDTLVGEALAGTSYDVRDDADAGPRLARSREWVDERLGGVSLDAPQGVTLSSTSGSFNIAVRNTLDQPVTVRIEASTDRKATIKAANPIVLPANSRASIPISADMKGPGVHNVRLRLTDADGNPIGTEDELPIRSGQVGVVIWVIMGTGAGILFLAIGIRLVRRFRRRGEPDPEPTPQSPAETVPDTEPAG
ncbi:DUF6049 family protein [Pimelobacter simplex]|uniref:DUF6049 family protein n=1 Tax=Nocardioides simplex TaxID=2045 RepID=UPI003AAE62C8